MLSLSTGTRVFVALAPADLRQSFNGLCARVQSVLGQDPTSGHLYVFANRRLNRIKVLLFDGSGLWICAKRLERGKFSWPQGSGVSRVLRSEQWMALVSGLEVREKAGWYRR